ncbi:MAG TPA: hypothetical protein VIX37_24835 [Candidatus Sulfotelmatobacter sp.]
MSLRRSLVSSVLLLIGAAGLGAQDTYVGVIDPDLKLMSGFDSWVTFII